MRGDLRYEVEYDLTADGMRYRAVALDDDWNVVDSTRSTPNPARATRDLLLLQAGRYWVTDGGDPHREWSHAA